MPIANKYSIEEILKCMPGLLTGIMTADITFEYSLVEGVNDSEEDARAAGKTC